MTNLDIDPYIKQIQLPPPNSHKGQNGKVMVIGGSELFHAASQWALTVVSRLVDMVFYSSVPSNNELIKEAKQHFHNGIVVPRQEIENYIDEADVVLIGPGMERSESSVFSSQSSVNENQTSNLPTQVGIKNKEKNLQLTTPVCAGRHTPQPTTQQWNNDTEKVVNYLLSNYPDKKWVVDAGALQMVDPSLLNKNCIITTHSSEFLSLMKRAERWWFDNCGELSSNRDGTESVTVYIEGGSTNYLSKDNPDHWLWNEERHQGWLHRFLQEEKEGNPETDWSVGKVFGDLKNASASLHGTTILRKGIVDEIGRVDLSQRVFPHKDDQFELVKGGNAGMTKGGTGDVLAGLVSGLYTFSNDPFAVAVVASAVNKMAGEELFESVGPFFNASDLADQIPMTLAKVFGFVG